MVKIMSQPDILYQSSNIKYDKGFVYVASLKPKYYEYALVSAQSLRDFYPESNITLFTHIDFVDERAEKLFDKIYVNIPHSRRAKMWCMTHTPYDITVYNDADSIIRRPKIKKIFDQLDQNDMSFGPISDYTVSRESLCYADLNHKHKIKYHGSLCLYHKSDLNLNFHQTWYDEYLKQLRNPWEHAWADPIWKDYDMHTLWRITNNFNSDFSKFKKIKIGCLDTHWNAMYINKKRDLKEPPIVTQINRTFIENIYRDQYNKNIEYYGKKIKVENSGDFS